MNRNPLSACALLVSMVMATPLAWAVDHTGKVLETMNSGGYTYAKISENQNEIWIAGPATTVQVGDVVSFGEQMWMPGFTSKTLNRKFDKLLFVGSISQGTSVAMAKSPHPKAGNTSAVAAPEMGAISKAEDGYTIAELFSRRGELKGKQVKVHGQVVKVSNDIMSTNWIHIQDGTSDEGNNDVIFRAKTDTANVGDVVMAQGILVTDQDFGYSYQYAVLVEDATFEVSK